MCSAIITVVRCVLARGISGITEASTTRSPSIPITRQFGSTTDQGSLVAPIRHVPQACQNSPYSAIRHRSSWASVAKSSGPRPLMPTCTASVIALRAGCRVKANSRRTPSRSRIRSRSSESMRKSISGATSGSAVVRNSLPTARRAHDRSEWDHRGHDTGHRRS